MAERLATLIGIYALLGLGYQVVFGQLRALNLAQGALFGVGAYATALTAPHLGPFALLVAPIASAAVAALAAPPILRLQSHYFALATLALASLINLVAVNAESLTGGANGLVGFNVGLRGTTLTLLVWLVLLVAVAAYAWVFNGAMDRYDFKLVGKKEMLVPYNAFKLIHAKDPLAIQGPITTLSSRPGLGVEVDWQRVRQFACD